MGHLVMVDGTSAEEYPLHFSECAHEGDLDQIWIPRPFDWTGRLDHHEAHCMECGADTVAVHEVEYDIGPDDSPTARIVRATWAEPMYADQG